MNETQLAEKLRIDLSQYIKQLDLPGFFIGEVEQLLTYLNYYKLKNLVDNKDLLEKYLLQMSYQYTQEIETNLNNKNNNNE